MMVDSENATGMFNGQVLYGIADQTEEDTATASNPIVREDGSGMYGNITSRFRLPELPNP